MEARRNATTTTAGILRPEDFATYASLERAACAPAVSAWVENYWLLRWSLPDGQHYVSSTLPHPACNLTVELGEARDGVGDDRVVITGLTTERFDVSTAGTGWVLGVKFRPGGLAALVDLDASALTDRVVPAVELLPRTVTEELRDLHPGLATDEVVARVDAALLPLAHDRADPANNAAYDTLLTVVADMLADRSLLRVAQVVERHAISRRQVERLFSRYIGIGPKWLLARYRMHDAVAALDAGYAGSLADLAAEHGWYDQAHFARDFTGLVGVPPSEYRAT